MGIASKETFISLLNSLKEHIALLDNKGVIVFVNKSWKDFADENHAHSQNYFLGENYCYYRKNTNQKFSEEAKAICDSVEKVLTGVLLEYYCEYPCHSPEKERWFSLELKPLKPEGYIAKHSDITHRVLTQKKIDQQDIFIEETQSLAKIGSWEFNFESNQLTNTPELLEICGIEKGNSEIMDSVFLSHFYNENEDALFRWLSYASPQQSSKEFEFNITTPKGETKRIYSKAVVKFSEHNLPLSLFAFIQDITEQHQKKKEITDLYKELSDFNSQLQKVREEERIEIAREIHDEIGQQLTVIKLKLGNIIKAEEKDIALIKQKALGANEIVNEIFKNVKKILSSLRPAALDDLGLISAIEWHLTEFKKKSNINFEFTYENTNNYYDKTISSNIYRIIQEASTNVLKHAKADLIVVKIKEENNSLNIEFSDNGCGNCANDTTVKNSFGIIGIKERVNILRGDFKMENRKDGGLLLKILIPLT